ncbi:hypothetical protein [Nocardia brasiliensis]|uniref:hypothetical protein n=1 Tax=Nocardia brasiliensis TaxID=37326 RepID=UPI003D8F399E
MGGPHTEFGADFDGGILLPGVAANTHHFGNAAGYVATLSYGTPTATGEAGVSVDIDDPGAIRVTGYTGTSETTQTHTLVINVEPLDSARNTIESWIRLQPGGDAALEALTHLLSPPPGQYPQQTIEIAGATIRYSGTVETVDP